METNLEHVAIEVLRCALSIARRSVSTSPLRELRARAGLTQTALAERAGVDQSAISAYEKGRRQMSDVVAHKIARVLKVSPEALKQAAEGAQAFRAENERDEVMALRVFQEAPPQVQEWFRARKPSEPMDFFAWVLALREDLEAWHDIEGLKRAIAFAGRTPRSEQALATLTGLLEKKQADIEKTRTEVPVWFTEQCDRAAASLEEEPRG